MKRFSWFLGGPLALALTLVVGCSSAPTTPVDETLEVTENCQVGGRNVPYSSFNEEGGYFEIIVFRGEMRIPAKLISEETWVFSVPSLRGAEGSGVPTTLADLKRDDEIYVTGFTLAGPSCQLWYQVTVTVNGYTVQGWIPNFNFFTGESEEQLDFPEERFFY